MPTFLKYVNAYSLEAIYRIPDSAKEADRGSKWK